MKGLSGSYKFLVAVPVVPHHRGREEPAWEQGLTCSGLLNEPQLLPSQVDWEPQGKAPPAAGHDASLGVMCGDIGGPWPVSWR